MSFMRKKGRKWDDQTPRVRPKCLEAAREVAKKINSRLIAEGFLKLPEENSARSAAEVHNMNDPAAQALPTLGGSRGLLVGTTSHDQQCTVEIDINEIPLACRNLLTRSVTQEDISKMSGAKVSTKGRFMTSTEKMMSKLTGEKALHLCVQGAVASSVELAVQRITSIISSTCNIPPTSLSIMSQNMPLSTTSKPLLMPGPPSSLNFTPQTLAFVQDKLFIGLEQAPPTFDIKTKLLGPNGTYLHHIQSETGAKVLLRGRGSGFNEPTSGREAFEPMHIYIQHSNHVGLNQARTLAQNLLQTVQHEYATFQQQLAFMPPSVLPATASMLAGLQQQQQNFTGRNAVDKEIMPPPMMTNLKTLSSKRLKSSASGWKSVECWSWRMHIAWWWGILGSQGNQHELLLIRSGEHRPMIDYILVRDKHRKYVKNVKAIPDGKSSKDTNSSKGNTKISFSLADSPAVKPKKLEGALGGIVAYGSDSEEDSET
ncbi:hypothetical protein HELRODRAFT_190259 [Helobdella robusta]|uniref:KH homology domain-containing protein 4 n=1 Tax=Helobdella robusta TaxID=6412 RepID=T1FRT8_HELRO|nr:hypothetical protein HELRODRAFT_190259 [Helobdella robusta]ESO10987.1 hypothetical protein HELRODRAFT_190259 [Helobdella robusta]